MEVTLFRETNLFRDAIGEQKGGKEAALNEILLLLLYWVLTLETPRLGIRMDSTPSVACSCKTFFFVWALDEEDEDPRGDDITDRDLRLAKGDNPISL